MRLRHVLLTSLATVALASGGVATAAAQPAPIDPAPQTSVVTGAAALAQPCGFSFGSAGGAQLAFWRTCNLYGQFITVDRALAPDFTTCVGIGQTVSLGPSTGPGAVRGASVIGNC